MANYHYSRTEEHNKKISMSKLAYYSNPENIEKHRQASLNFTRKPVNTSEPMIKIKGVNYYSFLCIDCDKPHYTQKIKGKPRNPRCLSCAAIIRGTGRVHGQEEKDKISKSLMGHPVSEKARNSNRDLAKRKIIGDKIRLKWQDREFVLKICKRINLKPNKPEKALSYIIRHTAPHMYKYNGDGRLGVTLFGRIPDFVNVNGKKQVIELFGEYWHGEKRTHRTKEQEVDRLQKHYSELGYKCLIIWEFDLKDKESVKQRIREFAGV